MNIFIWGMGLLGASFALRIKKSGHHVSGVVRTEKSRSVLMQKGFENILLANDENIQNELLLADILVFATPVEEIFTITQKFGFFREFKNLKLITDMSSTKESVMNFMGDSPAYIPFIGSHPMAGSENNGPQFADDLLFEKASVYITLSDKLSEQNNEHYKNAGQLLCSLWQETGAVTMYVPAQKHDEWLAYLSHGLHLISCACATLTDKIPDVQNLPAVPVAGSFKDMTRVATSSPELWEGIILSNRLNTVAYLDTMIKLLSQWKNDLSEEKMDIKNIFREAATLREKILRDK